MEERDREVERVTDGETDGWREIQMERQTDFETDRWRDRYMQRWMEEPTDGETNRHTYWQAGRLADILANILADL